MAGERAHLGTSRCPTNWLFAHANLSGIAMVTTIPSNIKDGVSNGFSIRNGHEC